MANMGVVVSSALALGAFAGLATGFIYLLIAGIRWARCLGESVYSEVSADRGEGDPLGCYQCGRSEPSLPCTTCHRRVCDFCSATTPHHRHCNTCLKRRDTELQTGNWIFKELRDRFQTTVASIRGTKRGEEDVREVIEKLTEELVGGSLDYVRITKLSSHPWYINLRKRYQGNLSLTLARLSTAVQVLVEDSSPLKEYHMPKRIHLQLKELIIQIMLDARSLPVLEDIEDEGKNKCEDLSTMTYEDILATAILNKIIEKYQIRRRKRSTLQGSESSDMSNVDDTDSEDSFKQSTNSLDSIHNPFNNEDDSRFPTKLQLYDEIRQEPEARDEMTVNTHLENWLFTKRSILPNSPSVPMLVPNPNENIKTQIGDRDADEMENFSDTSDTDIIQIVDNGYVNQKKQTSKFDIGISDPSFKSSDMCLSGEESIGMEQNNEYTETTEQILLSQKRSKETCAVDDKVTDTMNCPQKEKNSTNQYKNDLLSKIENGNLVLPNVRQLAKQFSAKHNQHKVHSLTARNLARGMQENLKRRTEESPSRTDYENSEARKEYPAARPRVHSNIEFWEQLAQKKNGSH